MRIFAVSDIHVDYDVNARWVADLSDYDYVNDILIVAGDISDSLNKLASCLQQFTQKFKMVFYVPGNHDIWLSDGMYRNSIEKFYAVCKCADDLGVVTSPKIIDNICILPLYSWYDFSFGEPSDNIKSSWMDFRKCIWPGAINDPKKITAYFLKLNQNILDNRQDLSQSELTIITFSHFLPRIDLMPRQIPKSKREIYPVLGSSLLDGQLRTLGSNIHIYGHSHVNQSIQIEGTYYINNAFAYPSETHISRKLLVDIFEERNRYKNRSYW